MAREPRDLEIEIAGRHHHIANGHGARPGQHEHHRRGHLAGLDETSRRFRLPQVPPRRFGELLETVYDRGAGAVLASLGTGT